jgi:uncharacterized YccA/Bax inhibitor family protein
MQMTSVKSDLVRVGRVTAVALSAGTFLFLFVLGSWRADNLFLIPDLIACAALAVAAVLPAHRAAPALTVAFAVTAGVFLASVSSYAVEGRIGWASLGALVIAAVMASALSRERAAVAAR